MKTYYSQLTKEQVNAIDLWIGEHNIMAPTIADVSGNPTLDLNFEDIYIEDGDVYYCQIYEWVGTDSEEGNIYEPIEFTKLATMEEMLNEANQEYKPKP